MKTELEIPEHPAQFSDPILPAVEDSLVPGMKVLDPFAGVGRIHELATVETWGVELEYEWAAAHPRTIVGNALHLPFPDRSFDAIATSPCYGNRMADAHNAQERCKPCKGTGSITKDYGLAGLKFERCEKCKGAGRRKYKRITYTHYMGRKLHLDNSGAMQWGSRYRTFHERAWAEASRVVRGRFVLNIKDHVRARKFQGVPEWHQETLENLGWTLVRDTLVEVPGMGFGQNRDARAEFEHVMLFTRAA